MPVRAGQIVVEMTAGTRTFVTDVEVAKTKLREFGAVGQSANAGMVSSTKATTATMKAMEGQFANNNRAAAAFVNTILGGGRAMQAIFPLVGGLAFAGMLTEVVGKVQDFFKNLAEAPERSAAAFRGIFEPLQKGNDELQVTNDKLAMEIGKLSGHPGNGLQLALHEAWVVADKLEATVSKTLKELGEVQKKDGISALNAFFTGRTDTKGDEADIKKFTASMAHIDAEGMASVRAAKTKEDAGKAQDAWNKKALDALDLEIQKYEKLTEATGKLQNLHEAMGKVQWGGAYPKLVEAAVKLTGGRDQSVKLEEQQGTLGTLKGLRDRYSLSADEASLQGKLPGAQAAAEARKKAEAEQKRERELENRHDKEERADWQHLIEERAHVKEEFLSGMEKIDVEEQAEIQRELEKARTMLGEGVSGPVAVDPAKLEYIHGTFDAKRSGEAAREATKFWDEINKAIAKGLGEELQAAKAAMERSHAADEQVANISLASQREGLNRNAKTDEDVAKHGGLTGVDLVNAEYQIRIKLANDLAKIEDERVAKEKAPAEIRRLTAEKEAALAKATGEAEAERERGLAALRQKDMRDFFEEMRTEAETTGHILYSALHSALDRSSDQLAKLVTGQKTDIGKTVQEVGQGMVKDSIKSAMMQGLGKLGSLLGIKAPGKHDGSSADAFLFVKDVGKGGGARVGLPGLGGLSGGGDSGETGSDVMGSLGALIGGGADKGSGETGSDAAPTGTVGKILGTVGKVVGLFAKIFGGGMASGGDVDPGHSYVVGESGWEVFTPRTAGSITPAGKLGSGGGPTYNVDARGADFGAANRVSRAIEAAHHAAVTASMAANAERTSRTPQRSR
jgi:hypothetical protein